MGSVDLSLLGALLIGSLPGVVLGSVCASRVPDHVLRPIFAAVLFVVGGRLLL